MRNKVMVFDLDADVLFVISEVLVQSGYEAYPIGTYENFETIIPSKNPDLIIIDWRCCALSNICEFLRRNYPALPVLILATLPGKAIDIAAKYNLPLLEKPFDIDELTARVEEMIAATV